MITIVPYTVLCNLVFLSIYVTIVQMSTRTYLICQRLFTTTAAEQALAQVAEGNFFQEFVKKLKQSTEQILPFDNCPWIIHKRFSFFKDTFEVI